MKRGRVEIAEDARRDPIDIFDWIAREAGEDRALVYLDRLERFVTGLDLASLRGWARDDIRPGLRVVGFERRPVIAFSVDERRVVVLRVFILGGTGKTRCVDRPKKRPPAGRGACGRGRMRDPVSGRSDAAAR